MTDYEITVEGKRGEALVALAEQLGQIAADNTKPSDYAKIGILLRSKEGDREQIAQNFVEDYTKSGAPFTPAGARILLKQSDWGHLRPEISDVQVLSQLNPDDTFYFTTVTPNETRVEIDLLENYSRCRIQNGSITAIYEAQPVVWDERLY